MVINLSTALAADMLLFCMGLVIEISGFVMAQSRPAFLPLAVPNFEPSVMLAWLIAEP